MRATTFFPFLFLSALASASVHAQAEFGHFDPRAEAEAAAFGNAHTFRRIDTCYHWLEPSQLQAKIDYARAHNGDLEFFGNEVIYCWRSPLGAYSAWEAHGDELIRIKFKPGIAEQMINKPRTGSSTGNRAAGAEVIYSNDNSWQEYTITQAAVESWSVYQPFLIGEMKAELAFYDSGAATEDDVFYPFSSFDRGYLHSQLDPIIAGFEEKARDQAMIFGTNLDRHFETKYPQPWAANFDRKAIRIRYRAKIAVVEASYGKELDAANADNALPDARNHCDGKSVCDFKVSPRFIPNPAPETAKVFAISWRCGDNGVLRSVALPAPAENAIAHLECGFEDDEKKEGEAFAAAQAKAAREAKAAEAAAQAKAKAPTAPKAVAPRPAPPKPAARKPAPQKPAVAKPAPARRAA